MVTQSSAENANENSPDWRVRMKDFYDDAMSPFGKKPCDGARADYKACLLASDCHRLQKKTLRECSKCTDSSVPEECHALRRTFFECKRSLLDNRQRFRGRKGY